MSKKLVLEGSLEDIKRQLMVMEAEKRKGCRHIKKGKKGGIENSLLKPISPTKREHSGLVGHNLMKCKECGTIIDMDNLIDDEDVFASIIHKAIDNFEFLKIYDKNFNDDKALDALNWIEDNIWQLTSRHKKVAKKLSNSGNKNKKKKKSFFDEDRSVDRSFDYFSGLKSNSKKKKKKDGNAFYR